MADAEIGIFGGSGFYSFLDEVEEVELETPYGKPSAAFVLGEIGGKRVAFLPRHGHGHELPPHRIPYRANVWGMRELGVRRIIGPNASGALKAELRLGEFVVCDQFVDRTTGRADTFYDGPETTHVSAADPYCPDLRRLLVETAGELGIPARDGGTVVTIQGPRFSTRAESKWFQNADWDVINLDGHRPRRRRRGDATGVARGSDRGVRGEQRAASRVAVRNDPKDRTATRGRLRHSPAGGTRWLMGYAPATWIAPVNRRSGWLPRP
jgi:5'-methylthioadenosine phosphorylase